MDKADLRKIFSKKRNNISAREKKESIVFDKIIKLIKDKKCNNLFCYVSMGSELSTHRIIKYFFDNMNIYVPYTQNGEMCIRRLLRLNFEADKHGNIKECYLGDSLDIAPDVTLVPMLAFDLNGYRLGYGGGYYDRFLSSKKNTSIGLAFDEQFIDSLPIEAFDERLQIIVTPLSELFFC